MHYPQFCDIQASVEGGFDDMLRTILLGSCVSVQGTFVRNLPDGCIAVRVGDRIFSGLAVLPRAA